LVAGLRITLTGATGLIGPRLLDALRADGAALTVLSRNPDRARERFGDGVEVFGWDPIGEAAPVEALSGRDIVVHLAGEPIAQRWSAEVKRDLRESRVQGTRNLIDGLQAVSERPAALISSSAVGYYGPHGEEPLDEDAPPGNDFLAEICAAWEAEAMRASELGMRVAVMRNGVVLDRDGGALAKMLPPFRLGVGGPVAGGAQFISWVHAEDVVGMIRATVEDERWSGPFNVTAPTPVSNRDFSRALGRALHRPALLPVPGFALQALYGEMSVIVTTGARVVPAKALVLGYEFAHGELDEALSSALGA
jgi:uncharacterized protein (TIGR01777 family)